jgi:hypothetical protein
MLNVLRKLISLQSIQWRNRALSIDLLLNIGTLVWTERKAISSIAWPVTLCCLSLRSINERKLNAARTARNSLLPRILDGKSVTKNLAGMNTTKQT